MVGMSIHSVTVRRESAQFPTYLPGCPDTNPMFLEKRVYQGSSGRVYPLPFIDRIAETAQETAWDTVHLENEFLYVMILPEIGGRIHVLRDKTNGCDVIYNQPVIKPALVGLAGPWISGGIEFNWPQHHRPTTFQPTDVEIERHPDGAVTVWLSEHDPMARMKGMHGVCLHPGRAVLEVKVRAYNRTPLAQTFLWWANVATRVHERYQSFFPPDVSFVADHARRAMSRFPLCAAHYYGVDYASRSRMGVPAGETPRQFVPVPAEGVPACVPNDLSWYANIPVPTSYMCLGSKEDFFGGYDYKTRAGLVHIADHRIAPGKKQWTWGNHEFGYAWDRNLTDPEASGEYPPYIELMAGVFTDNQPDFSHLLPGETRSWSQYWYPIREIGAATHANLEAAVNLRVEGARAQAGVSVTRKFPSARVLLRRGKRILFQEKADLGPDAPFVRETKIPAGTKETDLCLAVTSHEGREIIACAPKPRGETVAADPATEPPAPSEIAGTDELYLTGLHLEQYRHATRCPEPYWREALRRDPGDARCHNALGLRHLRRGEFDQAEGHFREAIRRYTSRNPNPRDGEPFYNLGIALRFLQRDDEAYDAFAKAAWNEAWKAAACHAMAEGDCRKGNWTAALAHLEESLGFNSGNLRARDLKVVVLRQMDREAEASATLAETLALDPLDWWARHLHGQPLGCDNQVRLDLAHDYAKAGLWGEAVAVLSEARPEPGSGTAPLLAYTLGYFHEKNSRPALAKAARGRGRTAPPDYCFPARLEEIAVLETAMAADPGDARAPYYLGNLYYDRLRHEEAIRLWERAAERDPKFPTVWRNLGIGCFNIRRQPSKARQAYDRAFGVNANDARVLYERDQLWKRLARPPKMRLRELEKHPRLVARRDDLSVEICALYNQTGQPEKARGILATRKFQPWEGGEGQALGQHTRAHLLLGRGALTAGVPGEALEHFQKALDVPPNLGEARHLLANTSDIWFWLGETHAALGNKIVARQWWRRAADFRGDFQEMSVRAFSELTLFSILSLQRLKRKAAAHRLATSLLAYAGRLSQAPAQIDYFATSLPTMLLFDEDLQARQSLTARFLKAQALFCLGHKTRAAKLAREVLVRDPSHPAADFLTLLT